MPSLEELLNSSLSGIIQGGGLPTENALYQRQAQAERESTFGRGLGISSVTRDALAKARTDAALAAQSAQLSALGQAAGITQQTAARAQQESQFGRSLGQQNKALGQQKDIANQQMLAGGLGAGAGAVAGLAGMAFRPEIQSGVRSLAGLGARPSAISPAGGNETMAPPGAVPNTMGSFTDPTGGGSGGGGGPSLDMLSGGGQAFNSGSNFSSPSFSPSDFSNFDASFGGLDLSNLYDTSFDPYQWGSYY